VLCYAPLCKLSIVTLTERRKTTAAEKVLYGLMFLSLALLFWLDFHYYSTCPRGPDLQSGRIYPLDNRGTVVYLTKTENLNMHAAEGLFFGLWLFGVGFSAAKWGLKKLKIR
jgi:hypothetical protein